MDASENARFDKMDDQFTKMDGQFDLITKLLVERDRRMAERFAEQDEKFQRHIGVIMERLGGKIDLIAEGHQMLADKLDRLELSLTMKIDKIASVLAAHCADPHAHQGFYGVREPDPS